jgi:hypothetical protein
MGGHAHPGGPPRGGGGALEGPVAGPARLRLRRGPGTRPPPGPLDVLVLGAPPSPGGGGTAPGPGASGGASVAEERGSSRCPRGSSPWWDAGTPPPGSPCWRTGSGRLAALVDAAHPFAQEAHQAFRIAARRTGCPFGSCDAPPPCPKGPWRWPPRRPCWPGFWRAPGRGPPRPDPGGAPAAPPGAPPEGPEPPSSGPGPPHAGKPGRRPGDGAGTREVLCQWGPGTRVPFGALLEESGARALVSKASGARGAWRPRPGGPKPGHPPGGALTPLPPWGRPSPPPRP